MSVREYFREIMLALLIGECVVLLMLQLLYFDHWQLDLFHLIPVHHPATAKGLLLHLIGALLLLLIRLLLSVALISILTRGVFSSVSI